MLSGKVLKRVTVGSSHTCAVDSTGQTYCWGSGGGGRLGTGLNADSIRPVAVSVAGTLAGRTVTRVDAGFQHTCVTDAAGRPACWGYNGNAQIGDGTTTARTTPQAVITSGALSGQRIIEIGVGSFHACGLGESGKALCWGAGTYLGDGINTQSGAPVAVVNFGP